MRRWRGCAARRCRFRTRSTWRRPRCRNPQDRRRGSAGRHRAGHAARARSGLGGNREGARRAAGETRIDSCRRITPLPHLPSPPLPPPLPLPPRRAPTPQRHRPSRSPGTRCRRRHASGRAHSTSIRSESRAPGRTVQSQLPMSRPRHGCHQPRGRRRRPRRPPHLAQQPRRRPHQRPRRPRARPWARRRPPPWPANARRRCARPSQPRWPAPSARSRTTTWPSPFRWASRWPGCRRSMPAGRSPSASCRPCCCSRRWP
jgi:hypothetical protein